MDTGGVTNSSINIFNLLRVAIFLIIAIALLIVFVGVPQFVSGESMEPNFHTGEMVFVEKLSYSGKNIPRRFDIVAAKFPADPKKTRLIKRVIGIPGDTVEIETDRIFVNEVELDEPYQITPGEPPYQPIATTTLKEGEYFLIGDNRPGSSDSRLWGAVQRQDIQGKVWAILWPPRDAKVIVQDFY